MLYVWIIYLIACLIGTKYSANRTDYLDKEQTDAVKGIFAGIIMFSHFRQYAELNKTLSDALFLRSINSIGQLMVVMFLFYSGYGIVVSSKKNDRYFDTFFRHRILHTLFYFDLAVILFVITGLFRGKIYPLKQVLLSFIGWNSVGNSNWFVFAILAAYVFTLIAAKAQNNKLNLKALFMVLGFCIIYIVIMRYFKEKYWYNTIMTYPAGMFFGYFKNDIDSILKNHYPAVLIFSAILFSVAFYLRNFNIIVYLVCTVLFALLIVELTYVIKTGNSFLAFMGKYSFDIYLLQRIPAMLLQNQFQTAVVYFAVFAAATLICAVCFHAAVRKTLAFVR